MKMLAKPTSKFVLVQFDTMKHWFFQLHIERDRKIHYFMKKSSIKLASTSM